MQNDDEALLSISLVIENAPNSWATYGISSLNFAYLYILRLSSVYQMIR